VRRPRPGTPIFLVPVIWTQGSCCGTLHAYWPRRSSAGPRRPSASRHETGLCPQRERPGSARRQLAPCWDRGEPSWCRARLRRWFQSNRGSWTFLSGRDNLSTTQLVTVIESAARTCRGNRSWSRAGRAESAATLGEREVGQAASARVDRLPRPWRDLTTARFEVPVTATSSCSVPPGAHRARRTRGHLDRRKCWVGLVCGCPRDTASPGRLRRATWELAGSSGGLTASRPRADGIGREPISIRPVAACA